MKHWFIFLSLSIVLCSLAAAQSSVPAPQTRVPSVEDELVKLERSWLAAEASGDITTLRGLIADDFIGSSSGAKVLTKDDILPALEANTNRFPKSSLGESTVRVSGDCAVLMGTVVFDDPKLGGLRVTNVYQKRGDGWQMIAAHLSPTPAAE
ncbi:MAG TPA: nuclear transport factor 2 family protein [Terriglobales bacterium]|jgi:ketosteroid isomerase-like protein|nr:nuclear transport factor 2 family protein [Terriglobales bacterium]